MQAYEALESEIIALKPDARCLPLIQDALALLGALDIGDMRVTRLHGLFSSFSHFLFMLMK